MESLIAPICYVAKILAILEQFTIVVVNTLSQVLANMHIASRILNFRMTLLLYKDVMIRRKKVVQQFPFKLRITP